MATKGGDINTINSFDNRQVLKNLNVGKTKGLRVRETVRNDDSKDNEVDENVYAKSKPNHFPKANIAFTNQRSPLATIPGPTKPAFSVYCDDDLSQDGCGFNARYRESCSKCEVEVAVTDFSTCEKDTSEKPTVSRTLEKRSCTDVGQDEERHEKSSDVDDAALLSTVNDDSTVFHTADSVTEQVDARREEELGCHPDYDHDIYLYMRRRERDLSPSPRYLYRQTDISLEMRYILVDWLADVALEYDLSLESLHLAVSIVDRTLSKLHCPRLKLQLVGATAIMIASKFEEIFPPELKEFVYITDETYSATQILRMEKVILNTLCFEISAPTANWFGARLARLACSDKETSLLMDYLLELALLDYRYLQYRSSVLACAAFCLANVIIGSTPWPSSLEHETGISLEELKEPLHLLLDSFTKAPTSEYKAVYEKYSDDKYRAVACLVPPSSLPVQLNNKQVA